MDQKLFIGSFYCYLNYDTKKDFVIDLDNVWKWMGFSKKYHANTVLTKYFMEKIDYIQLAAATSAARSDDEKWGGQNIKKIMIDKLIQYKEYYFKSLGEKLFL